MTLELRRCRSKCKENHDVAYPGHGAPIWGRRRRFGPPGGRTPARPRNQVTELGLPLPIATPPTWAAAPTVVHTLPRPTRPCIQRASSDSRARKQDPSSAGHPGTTMTSSAWTSTTLRRLFVHRGRKRTASASCETFCANVSITSPWAPRGQPNGVRSFLGIEQTWEFVRSAVIAMTIRVEPCAVRHVLFDAHCENCRARPAADVPCIQKTWRAGRGTAGTLCLPCGRRDCRRMGLTYR